VDVTFSLYIPVMVGMEFKNADQAQISTLEKRKIFWVNFDINL